MRFKLNEHLPIIRKRFGEIVEKPVLTSFLVLISLAALVIGLSYHYYVEDNYNFVGQVLAEAHGMLFDIAVIGILIYWLNENGQKNLRIRTYKDEIDDFRLWESEEAAFRTAGNIKRLNRHRIYTIDLVNCHLARTNLGYTNMTRSNLNSANVSHSNLDQAVLVNTRMNQTNFEASNLNHAQLQKSYASGANFKGASLMKADLSGAFLIKASFENAFLTEANLRGAIVMGVNFANATLYKADLREVDGLTVEQLLQAKSLHQVQLDEFLMDEIRELKGSLLERST